MPSAARGWPTARTSTPAASWRWATVSRPSGSTGWSPTGRYAFFETASGQLAGDTNGHSDFYRRDLAGGVVGPLVLVTSDAGGAATAGPIGSVDPAEYGRLFAPGGDQVLVLTAQALVSADTNRLRDLYAKDLVSGVAGSPVG